MDKPNCPKCNGNDIVMVTGDHEVSYWNCNSCRIKWMTLEQRQHMRDVRKLYGRGKPVESVGTHILTREEEKRNLRRRV